MAGVGARDLASQSSRNLLRPSARQMFGSAVLDARIIRQRIESKNRIGITRSGDAAEICVTHDI